MHLFCRLGGISQKGVPFRTCIAAGRRNDLIYRALSQARNDAFRRFFLNPRLPAKEPCSRIQETDDSDWQLC